ncbi:MAG: DUF2391 family protein [Pseudomonadota bacterium]|nr:DUF2391 family protein [Pseudomonadota bacterium]
MPSSFNTEDVIQIAIGAFALSIPIAFSEEAWKMAETLPLVNLMLIMFISMLFLVIYAYQNVFQANITNRGYSFVFRVFIAYLITIVVVGLVLASLNKLPIFTAPDIALKRIIIISMPAAMGAIIVDGLDKE